MNVQTTTRGPTRRQIVLGWTATTLPIGAWIVHLTGEAALVRLACEHRDVEWVMHGLTAGTALICLVCVAIGVSYAAPSGRCGRQRRVPVPRGAGRDRRVREPVGHRVGRRVRAIPSPVPMSPHP